jgi:hypothetical protein
MLPPIDSAVDLPIPLLPQEQLEHQFHRARDAVHRLIQLVHKTDSTPRAPSWEFSISTCKEQDVIRTDKHWTFIAPTENTSRLLDFLHQHVEQEEAQYALVRWEDTMEHLRHHAEQLQEYIAFMGLAPLWTEPIPIPLVPMAPGSVYARGQNDDGQCGIESCTWECVGTFDRVECGSMFTVALSQGRAVAWGLEEVTGSSPWDLPPLLDVACTESAIAFVTTQGHLYHTGFFRVLWID